MTCVRCGEELERDVVMLTWYPCSNCDGESDE